MKRTILIAAATLLLLLSSCSFFPVSRKITVRIPEHPWERASGKKLWYTIRWNDGQGVQSLHMTSQERTATFDVIPGSTILVVAYPLGDMAPFGALITPLEGKDEHLLTQEDGFVADLLIDLDNALISQINYGLITDESRRKIDDIREIDDVLFLQNLQNGTLSKASLKTKNLHLIGPFALSNGVWESECLRDPSLVVSEGMAGPIVLPSGVFRFLNVEEEMEFVLIVDSEGAFYSYLKPTSLQ